MPADDAKAIHKIIADEEDFDEEARNPPLDDNAIEAVVADLGKKSPAATAISVVPSSLPSKSLYNQLDEAKDPIELKVGVRTHRGKTVATWRSDDYMKAVVEAHDPSVPPALLPEHDTPAPAAAPTPEPQPTTTRRRSSVTNASSAEEAKKAPAAEPDADNRPWYEHPPENMPGAIARWLPRVKVGSDGTITLRFLEPYVIEPVEVFNYNDPRAPSKIMKHRYSIKKPPSGALAEKLQKERDAEKAAEAAAAAQRKKEQEDGGKRVMDPHEHILCTMPFKCPQHNHYLIPAPQTDVFPYAHRYYCCAIDSEPEGRIQCTTIQGTFYHCYEPGCTFNLCQRHFRAPVIDSIKALVVATIVAWKNRSITYAMAFIAQTVALILYTPVMRQALMIVACHPVFQCEFRFCWARVEIGFATSVYWSLVLLMAFGLGFPILMYLELSRRSNVLFTLFKLPGYGMRYVVDEEEDLAKAEAAEVTQLAIDRIEEQRREAREAAAAKKAAEGGLSGDEGEAAQEDEIDVDSIPLDYDIDKPKYPTRAALELPCPPAYMSVAFRLLRRLIWASEGIAGCVRRCLCCCMQPFTEEDDALRLKSEEETEAPKPPPEIQTDNAAAADKDAAAAMTINVTEVEADPFAAFGQGGASTGLFNPMLQAVSPANKSGGGGGMLNAGHSPSNRRRSSAAREVKQPQRLQLVAMLESVASVVLPRGHRRTPEQISEDYVRALASDVSIWEWNRFLMTDSSVYAGLYENYLFERIRQVPIVQVAKFLLLVPPLLFEQNTIQQLGFIAICESIFAVYMIVAAPYSNAWMVIISHLTSLHHFLLVMLQTIFVIREPDENLSYEVGSAMLGISITFFVLLAIFSAMAFATPVILQKLREMGKQKSFETFFGQGEKSKADEEIPLLLDPVDGLCAFHATPKSDTMVVSHEDLEHANKELAAFRGQSRGGDGTGRRQSTLESFAPSDRRKQSVAAAAGTPKAAAAAGARRASLSQAASSSSEGNQTKPVAAQPPIARKQSLSRMVTVPLRSDSPNDDAPPSTARPTTTERPAENHESKNESAAASSSSSGAAAKPTTTTRRNASMRATGAAALATTKTTSRRR